MSATLTPVVPTWDRIGTVVYAKKATKETVKCVCQWTPAKPTMETALQSLRCANMTGLDSLTASVKNITAILYQEWGAV